MPPPRPTLFGNGFSIEDATEEQELIALANAAIEKSVQEEEGATGGQSDHVVFS